MEIVPFEPEHLAQIDPPAMTAWQVRRFAETYESGGPAFTGIEGGVVLGCAGVVVEEGVGRAWACFSDAIRERPMVLHRAIVRGLRAVEQTHNPSHIETTVYERFPRARQWLERLGFRFEEELQNRWGTGMTYLRYVK